MIQPSVQHWQSMDWKNRMANAIRDPAVLLQQLNLPKSLLPAAMNAASHFPLRVPEGFVARMQKGNPEDPLLLQVLPLHQELTPQPGFSTDPTGDLVSMKTPGLLHKYSGRALLITTGACGIHCRYCFRRHFPYGEAHLDEQTKQQILDVLTAEHSIREIILSGGDPLMMSDDKLGALIQQLEKIPHLTRLRLHTRMPVVLPERITPAFINLCKKTRLQVVMVIHSNHANELDENVGQALRTARDGDITLLNQTVLLKKINDTADRLVDLSEALFRFGVQPYYLHQLDRVQGAGHFEVDDSTAIALHRECSEQLPGYLVPRLVREIEGEAYKLPVGPTI